MGKRFIEFPKERKDSDGKEDFSLVEIKGTPHCKKHGAMNVYKKIWRCYSEYGYKDQPGETMPKFVDRVCNACCLEVDSPLA